MSICELYILNFSHNICLGSLDFELYMSQSHPWFTRSYKVEFQETNIFSTKIEIVGLFYSFISNYYQFQHVSVMSIIRIIIRTSYNRSNYHQIAVDASC